MTATTNALDSFAYSYQDVSPRPFSETSADGPQTGYTYHTVDRDGLLEQANVLDPTGHLLAWFNYGYNADDRITSVITNWSNAANPNLLTQQLAAYGVGRLNELQNAQITGGQLSQDLNYGYDGNGNITQADNGSGANPFGVQFASYGPANTMPGASYDNAGNPTVIGGSGVFTLAGESQAIPTTYTFDGANRLVKVLTIVVGGASSESDMTYDGLGHLTRVVDMQNGGLVADHSYVWCGSERCVEYDNTQPITTPADKRYFPQGWLAGAGGTETIHANRAGFYYIKDQLGSVRAVLDVKGNLVTQYEYDPYGERRQVAGSGESDIGFAGYFHHEASGLDFALHRAYDSRFGRWLNRDPIGLAGGLNLYQYVEDDPTTMSDPSGDDPLPSQAQALLAPYFPGFNLNQVDIQANAQMPSGTGVNYAGYYDNGTIYFAAGSYDPNSAEGLSLIAHELTHALQDEEYNHLTPAYFRPLGDNLFRREYAKEALKHGLRRENFFEWLAYHVQERVLRDLKASGCH